MPGLVPQRTTNTNIRDHTWLASADGLEYAQSATLHAASLKAAGGHREQNWVKGGTPLGQITAAGATKNQYGLYDPAATDGRQKHVAFLVDSKQLIDPVTGQDNIPLSGAIIKRGQILVNQLPVDFDVTDADVSPHFIYR
ncbi:hypothetical protein [Gordonia phage GTE5]|uniref:Hypothetical structural protein n=1 Tax=Gordonia phage GTE5 TaxID=319522 RepID=Q2TLV0_9CAUD|nr:head decoration [Gordonia phage GTE5]AAY16493.1 hypothetical structural protein [Gordonia phage GTE5]AET09768.1 hypothetical protein [Gordonia phage GTE5]